MTTRLSRRDLLRAALAGGVAGSGWAGVGRALAAEPAAAGDWPRGPVKIVVGFATGSSPDLLARLFSEPLARAFGQPFIVENRIGAGGGLGADAVSKATDHHTIGVVGAAALTSVPLLYANLPYRPGDFGAVSVIGTSPMLMVANPAVAGGSPREFFDAARKAGDKWSYGSLGIGSSSHLGTELLKARSGIAAVHVPYNAAPAVLTAMMNGDLQMAVLPIGNALAQVQAGRVKAIAVTSDLPTPLAPGVPALPEVGVDSLNIEIWNAVMAPKAMPPAILHRVSDEVARLIRSDEMKQKLFQQGWIAEGKGPAALEARVKADTAMYGDIIVARNIKVEG